MPEKQKTEETPAPAPKAKIVTFQSKNGKSVTFGANRTKSTKARDAGAGEEADPKKSDAKKSDGPSAGAVVGVVVGGVVLLGSILVTVAALTRRPPAPSSPPTAAP